MTSPDRAPRPRAAHFLLLPELAGSPPNEAIISGLIRLGYDVDVFAPDPDHERMDLQQYEGHATARPFAGGWGYRGLLASLRHRFWRQYRMFSATAEDPLAAAACLARLHRRPMLALVDEIKSGSYVGDRSPRWKRLCQWAIRSADLCIVNDESRIALVQDYARRQPQRRTFVYPGCFRTCPPAVDRWSVRHQWGATDQDLVVAVSGGVNLTSGFDWLLESAARVDNTFLLVQPVNLDAFSDYLMRRAIAGIRGYVESQRLSWNDAWATAAACDVGVAIYRNEAPQFQHMGISSNRLCMFIAMGVPVIASRQPSFQFIEDFGCGVLVESEEEVALALRHIRINLDAMRAGARRAAAEYIRAGERFESLVAELRRLVPA